MALRKWQALWRSAVCIGSGVLTIGLAACNESLDSSAGCPLVCANAPSQIQTITLNGISNEASVPADLGLGSETAMLLSSRGDTLDTRVVVRFDTLPVVATTSTGTVPITYVDSAYLHVSIDSTLVGTTAPITISAYDVDTSVTNDTAVATMTPLFTPERFLGATTFASETLPSSATIALSNATILSKIQGRKRLRIGLRISAAHSVSARIYSVEALRGPYLTMRVSQDTSIASVALPAYSSTPVDDKVVSGNISDFTLVVIGTPVPSGPYLAVGGVPVSRTYFRFNLPSLIVDSAIVVRATLVLHQFGGATPNQTDTMLVVPDIGIASSLITDPARAAQIISTTLVKMEPLVTHPIDQGVKEVEIAPVFAAWALQNESEFPRAIILRSGQEVLSPQQALFYSSAAPIDTLRPQLRISYTLRSRIGAP